MCQAPWWHWAPSNSWQHCREDQEADAEQEEKVSQDSGGQGEGVQGYHLQHHEEEWHQAIPQEEGPGCPDALAAVEESFQVQSFT